MVLMPENNARTLARSPPLILALIIDTGTRMRPGPVCVVLVQENGKDLVEDLRQNKRVRQNNTRARIIINSQQLLP